jgi:hypothetical protein
MTAATTATVWGAALLCVAVFTAWRITGVIRRHYRHHRCANRRFMAGYRAGYRAARPHDRPATAQPTTSTEQRLPMVRPRLPADMGDLTPRPLVSAGTTHGRHAR